MHLHAACRPGEDNARCQARIDALIEALGVDPDVVVTEISEPSPQSEHEGTFNA